MAKKLLVIISAMMLASCQPNDKIDDSARKVPAINLADMDFTTAAGVDFFQYANGGWIANNPLKPEYARYGSFDELRENNVERLNDLFSQMSTMNPEFGTTDQKIVDLYKLGLDSTRLNSEGSEPLQKYLNQIYSIKDKNEFAGVLGTLSKPGAGGFFEFEVDADLMNSKMQVLYLQQGGLGMGDRDYYVDAQNKGLHKGYTKMLAKFFSLSGLEGASQRAGNAVKIEDELAAFSWTRVQNRDIANQYHPMSTMEIADKWPNFDWAAYFEALGVGEQEKIIVMQTSFFDGFDILFAKTGLDVLKDYLAASLINSASSFLSDDFYAANFDFFSTQMSGVTEQKARWKRAMNIPNRLLGWAVGQMYVKEYFPESYKQKMLQIVDNLVISLGQHIDALDWMSDVTKSYAKEKLGTFNVKIGYPDKWKDYNSLTVDPKLSYLENLFAARIWNVDDSFSKIGKETDPNEWLMTPQTVNAYYNPTTNEICFPAAILQPPFFNADADDAVNYGAIGVVIGHEMTHGFDDNGRLFDKDGNMKSWWAEEDEAVFNQKTAILVKQYSDIEIAPGVHANGELSLGENIADQGGLSIAWTALENALGGRKPKDIDGFNVAQRFFIAYAHLWAQNITEEEKLRLTKVDVHSLGENRVNAAVRNFPLFYEAFGITENDPMWLPENERVMIW